MLPEEFTLPGTPVLRYGDDWKEKTDATFFVYALDTTLKLVSSLQSRETSDPFWGPFVLAYFDAMRADVIEPSAAPK